MIFLAVTDLFLFLVTFLLPVARTKGRGYTSGMDGVADLTVILVVTGNIHHSRATNVKHIVPQLDQSQTSWTTKCPVMTYFDHIIGE